VHRDRLAIYLADQKRRRARELPRRQPDLVFRQRFFDRLPHFALRAKKSVGRHHVVDALIGAEMVVVIDKVLEALPRLV